MKVWLLSRIGLVLLRAAQRVLEISDAPVCARDVKELADAWADSIR